MILEKGNKRIAIEVKSSSSPKLTQGFFEALKVILPEQAFVIAQVDSSFPIKNDILAHNLKTVLNMSL